MSNDEYKPINEEYAKGRATGQGNVFEQGGAQGNLEYQKDRAQRAKAVAAGISSLRLAWIWVILHAVPVWSLLLVATMIWLPLRLFLTGELDTLPLWLEWVLPVAACGIVVWKRGPIIGRARRIVAGSEDSRWLHFVSHVLAVLTYFGLSVLFLYVFFNYLWDL